MIVCILCLTLIHVYAILYLMFFTESEGSRHKNKIRKYVAYVYSLIYSKFYYCDGCDPWKSSFFVAKSVDNILRISEFS